MTIYPPRHGLRSRRPRLRPHHSANNTQRLWAGTIIGSENGGTGCDPTVQIQACNDTKSLLACRTITGNDGTANVLAGLGADGEVSGNGTEAGSIENLVVAGVHLPAAGGTGEVAAAGPSGFSTRAASFACLARRATSPACHRPNPVA